MCFIMSPLLPPAQRLIIKLPPTCLGLTPLCLRSDVLCSQRVSTRLIEAVPHPVTRVTLELFRARPQLIKAQYARFQSCQGCVSWGPLVTSLVAETVVCYWRWYSPSVCLVLLRRRGKIFLNYFDALALDTGPLRVRLQHSVFSRLPATRYTTPWMQPVKN